MIIVEIAGFLGAEPEERFTTTGKRVITLRVATRVRQDKTVWWKVNIWGDKFDKMLPYLKKGSAVIIVGDMAMEPEIYPAKDGSNKVALTLNAEMIKFSPFGKPSGQSETGHSHIEDENPYQSASKQADHAQYASFGATSGDNGDASYAGDDLPF